MFEICLKKLVEEKNPYEVLTGNVILNSGLLTVRAPGCSRNKTLLAALIRT